MELFWALRRDLVEYDDLKKAISLFLYSSTGDCDYSPAIRVMSASDSTGQRLLANDIVILRKWDHFVCFYETREYTVAGTGNIVHFATLGGKVYIALGTVQYGYPEYADWFLSEVKGMKVQKEES